MLMLSIRKKENQIKEFKLLASVQESCWDSSICTFSWSYIRVMYPEKKVEARRGEVGEFILLAPNEANPSLKIIFLCFLFITLQSFLVSLNHKHIDRKEV